MALCLPRKRRATSLATRPRTLSVASITNHSCTTSAGFALKVDMSFLFEKKVWRALFHGRRSSNGNLLGGVSSFPAEPQRRWEALHYTKDAYDGQNRRRLAPAQATSGADSFALACRAITLLHAHCGLGKLRLLAGPMDAQGTCQEAAVGTLRDRTRLA